MIGVIGDLHLKQFLSYSDYVADRRIPEKKAVLDSIVKIMDKCDKIVFLGDQLNGKNNLSEVTKEFVEFIEKFNDKEVYIIAGNHEKISDGKTAIDFLKEIKGHNWHIITDDVTTIGKFDFLPYMLKSELDAKDWNEATKNILKKLKGNLILFCHHTISGCLTVSGCQTDIFSEIVLPIDKLKRKYALIVGGHIHKPQVSEGMVVAGSIFNNEVGERGKSVWIIDEKTLKVSPIPLIEGRNILKLENPGMKDFDDIIEKNSIIKVILNNPKKKKDIEQIRKKIGEFDAHLLLEQYPTERRKIISGDNLLEFSVEKLLEVYAKEKKVDYNKLKIAWDNIK